LLLTRVIISILWVPIILSIILFGEPIHTLILVALMIIVGVIEFNDIMFKRGYKPSEYVTVAGSLLLLVMIYIASLHSDKSVIIFVLGFIFIVSVVWHLFRDGRKNYIASIGATLLCLFYIALLFSHLILIRNLEQGNRLLVVLFLTIWASDVCAYIVGMSWRKLKKININRHEISKQVSPHKSWEGAVGGLIGGMWACVGSFYFFMPERWPGLVWSLVIGTIVSIGGMLGDFIESAIKRDADIKDSGTFLPGHGGLLDRFDSIIIGAPIFFYLVLFYYHTPQWFTGLLY